MTDWDYCVTWETWIPLGGYWTNSAYEGTASQVLAHYLDLDAMASGTNPVVRNVTMRWRRVDPWYPVPDGVIQRARESGPGVLP